MLELLRGLDRRRQRRRFHDGAALSHVPLGRARRRVPGLSAVQLPAGPRRDLSRRQRRHVHRLHPRRLAVLGDWAEDAPFIALLTPALILGVPLFDIAFVGIGRIVTGKVHSLTEWLAYTGRDHIHHRFEELGLSALLLKAATPREAVLILVQAACVLALWRCWRASGVGDCDPEPRAVFLGHRARGMMNA